MDDASEPPKVITLHRLGSMHVEHTTTISFVNAAADGVSRKYDPPITIPAGALVFGVLDTAGYLTLVVQRDESAPLDDAPENHDEPTDPTA